MKIWKRMTSGLLATLIVLMTLMTPAVAELSAEVQAEHSGIEVDDSVITFAFNTYFDGVGSYVTTVTATVLRIYLPSH